MRFHRATTALTLGTVLALVLPTAAGACDHDDGHGGWTSRTRDYSTVYLYAKVDATKPASWENSGRQTLILITEGLSFVDTIDVGLLPSDVCGDGWGIQEDLVRGLTREELPTVVDRATGEGVLGWPPLLDARHRELSDYVDVPDCVEVLPDIVTPPVVTPPVVTPPVVTPPVVTPPVVIEVSPVVVVPAAPTAPAATAVQAAPSFTG